MSQRVLLVQGREFELPLYIYFTTSYPICANLGGLIQKYSGRSAGTVEVYRMYSLQPTLSWHYVGAVPFTFTAP